MSLSSDGAVMTMPVQPAYQGGYGGNGSMWGGDWSAWIILFLIWGAFGGGWGNGFGGGFGGANGPGFQGYATRSDINDGFALNNLQSGINAIQGVRYDMATQACDTRNTIQNSTRDIIDNANANSRAILQALNDNYIRSLENENQSLKLAASQSNQNAVLMAAMDANKAEILRRTGAECPTPAYVVQPPQPVTFPNFCNTCNSCGC